jgi:hypothetical protein
MSPIHSFSVILSLNLVRNYPLYNLSDEVVYQTLSDPHFYQVTRFGPARPDEHQAVDLRGVVSGSPFIEEVIIFGYTVYDNLYRLSN